MTKLNGVFSLIKMKDIYIGDTLNMCRSAIRMTVWMCGIFLICRLGDDVNGRFHDISKILYQNSCPLSPLQSDKRLSKMIMAAKKPIFLYGCFNIRCIRDTFRDVSKQFHFVVLQLKNIFKKSEIVIFQMSYATFACFVLLRESTYRF